MRKQISLSPNFRIGFTTMVYIYKTTPSRQRTTNITTTVRHISFIPICLVMLSFGPSWLWCPSYNHNEMTQSLVRNILFVNGAAALGQVQVPFKKKDNNKIQKNLISLQTTTRIKGYTKEQVFQFIATPIHWPQIVLSSVGVTNSIPTTATSTTTIGNSNNNKKNNQMKMISSIEKPIRTKGESVYEVFGLPPVLPLNILWTCYESSSDSFVKRDNTVVGRLDLRSPMGVPNIAKNCRMFFEIQNDTKVTTTTKTKINSNVEKDVIVTLTMEYEPTNILGTLAIPILTIDNAIALKVLLPSVIDKVYKNKNDNPLLPIDEFRRLMGQVYGIAGIVHFIDLIITKESKLLIASGCPPYDELSVVGQCLALFWCLTGPIAYYYTNVSMTAVPTTTTPLPLPPTTTGIKWWLPNVAPSSESLSIQVSNDNDSSVIIVPSKGDYSLLLYGFVEVSLALLINIMYNTNNNSEILVQINPFINALSVQVIVLISWFYTLRKTQEKKMKK